MMSLDGASTYALFCALLVLVGGQRLPTTGREADQAVTPPGMGPRVTMPLTPAPSPDAGSLTGGRRVVITSDGLKSQLLGIYIVEYSYSAFVCGT